LSLTHAAGHHPAPAAGYAILIMSNKYPQIHKITGEERIDVENALTRTVLKQTELQRTGGIEHQVQVCV
jgi:hypothetical protein